MFNMGLHFNLRGTSMPQLFAVGAVIFVSFVCQSPSARADLTDANCGRISPDKSDLRTFSPWTASIFTRSPGSSSSSSSGSSVPKYKFFTSGVIIGPTTILTVARGPFGSPLRGSKDSAKLPPVHIFTVGVGLRSTDYFDKLENNTRILDDLEDGAQFSEVNFIEPHIGHEGGNEQFHFVLYHLKTVLDLKRPTARAICLPPSFGTVVKLPFGEEFLQSGFTRSALVSSSPNSNPNVNVMGHKLSVAKVLASRESECNKLFELHYNRQLTRGQKEIFCGQKSEVGQKTEFLDRVRRISMQNRNYSDSDIPLPQTVQNVDEEKEGESATPFRPIDLSPDRELISPANSNSNPSDTCFLHGSVLAFNFQKRWRLGGIVTLIPGRRRGKCSDRSIYFYGGISSHLSFLQKSISCSPDKFSCGDKTGTCIPLTSLCNKVAHCPNKKDEDPLLCAAYDLCPEVKVDIQLRTGIEKEREADLDIATETPIKLTDEVNGSDSTEESSSFSFSYHSCGFHDSCILRRQLCDGSFDCDDGSDESAELCIVPSNSSKTATVEQTVSLGIGSRLKGRKGFCSRVKFSTGVQKKCWDFEEGEEFKCEGTDSFGPKTGLSLSCKDSFYSNYDYSTLDMKCDSEGQWVNKKPFSCSRECGVHNLGGSSNSEKIQSLSPDVFSIADIFPWNVLIHQYKQRENETEALKLCSGVAISNRFLVTTADCAERRRSTDDDGGGSVAFFKPVSVHHSKNVEAGSLFLATENYWIPFAGQSNRTNRTFGFAVVKIQEPPPKTDVGPPACFLSSSRLTIAQMAARNISGQVAAFRTRIIRHANGSMENSEEVIKILDYKIVPNSECAAAFPNQTVPAYVFCAYSLKGGSLSEWEGGTGFYLKRKSPTTGNDQYFLKGIALEPSKGSAKFSTDSNSGFKSRSQEFSKPVSKPRVYQLFVNAEIFHDWTVDILEKYF